MHPVLSDDRNGCLRIWDHPKDGVPYVAGIDVAEGRKRDKSTAERRGIVSYSDKRADYSAIIVLDEETGQHVASWHGYVSPDHLASIAAAVGFYYNTALLVPEINGPGIAVITKLAETIQYPNIYRTRVFNVMDRDPHNPQLGWRTNEHSRKILMVRIHEVINSGQKFTRDAGLIGELRTMEFDDMGTERGRGKNKDDRVLALGMALQGRYEAIGGLQKRDSTRDVSDKDYMNQMAWQRVKEAQEKHGNRSGDRLFTGWAPRSRSRLRR